MCRENSSFILKIRQSQVLYFKNNMHFWSSLAYFVLEREMFQTRVVEKIKTQILYSITIFFPENCALYEIMFKYIAGQATEDNKIRPMRTACWIAKATNTHWEYVTIIAFPPHLWLLEPNSLWRYMYIAGCVRLVPAPISSLSTKPFCLLNIFSRVVLINSVCRRPVVALLFTMPVAFRGTWSFERARRKPLSCTRWS